MPYPPPSSAVPVALVLGGARRIGAAIVEALAADGYQLVIHYHRSEVDARVLAASLPREALAPFIIGADLRDRWAIQGLFDTLQEKAGRLDVLIHSASLFQRTPLSSLTPESWADLMAVNLSAPLWCAQRAAPLLSASTNGNLIFVSDIAGLRSWPGYAAYCAGRAGLHGMAASLALELAPSIRVNVIAAGAILWPEEMDLITRERLESRIPLGGRGAPEAIVRAVRYLLGNRFVTGEILRVDGGRMGVP